MIKPAFPTVILFLCFIGLLLMQGCLLDLDCVITSNGRTTITIKTNAPILVHTLLVQSGDVFPLSFNRNVLEQRVTQNKGAILAYTVLESGDTGSLEVIMQFNSPDDAGKYAALYGVAMTYTQPGRTFSCGFKDMGAGLSTELVNYVDLVLKNFDFTLRCTMPLAVTRAQNGTISGNRAVFSKSFTKLADFFQSAVYTVQW